MKTENERKQKAIEILKSMDIYRPYIRVYEQKNKVCFFEQFGGYWVDQEPEVEAKMREIEKEHNCTVYAITHEFTEMGEMWSFLLVPQYEEDWEYLVEHGRTMTSAYAYVWNKDFEEFSEFGNIGVQCFGGGLQRVA